jgi:hypothetical protein
LESSLRKNSARSVESLRSKSWAQFLDTTTPTMQQQPYYPTSSSSPGPLDVVSGTQDVQAAFYGQPARRFSHGWVPTTTMNSSSSASFAAASPTIPKNNSRLTTSYSYSDLHMAAALGSYRMNSSNLEICQQFRQYGYCTLKQQCPYSHTPTVLQQQHSDMPPQLRYSNSTSTCNSNHHHPLNQHHHHQQHHLSHTDPSLMYDPSNTTSLFRSTTSNNNMSSLNNNATASGGAAERRTSDNEMNKFAGLQLEEFQGKLYELCKDQHGCRFLQMKLEESSLNVTMIYQEIHLHFVDLMTDPFGNYLCQKLLERCDDEQRSNIVDVIAPEFLKICLSMHGTRAVQKLIEFLSTKRQVKNICVTLTRVKKKKN